MDESRPGSRRVRAVSRALGGCCGLVATRVGRHAYRHVHRGLKVVVVRVEELPTVIEILVPGDRREGRHLLVQRHVRHRARSTRACLARERRRGAKHPRPGVPPRGRPVPFHQSRERRTRLFTVRAGHATRRSCCHIGTNTRGEKPSARGEPRPSFMINRESSRNFYTRRLCMVYEPRAASDGTAALRPSVEGSPRRRRGAASSKKSFVRATRNARLRSRRDRTKPPRARVVRSPRPLRHPREDRSASSPPRRSRRHARARVSYTHIDQSLESPSS